jgi:hypothetical protein
VRLQDTQYANSFFYNVRPMGSIDGSFFQPPAACRGIHVEQASSPISQHFPSAFLSAEGQRRLLAR